MSRVARRGLGLILLALLALAACARVRALTGGPADTTPPQLLEITPSDSSTGIPSVPEIRIVFSEKVNPGSVRSGLRTYPDLDIERLSVKGAVVRVRFADTLASDTTLVVVLGRAIKDLPERDNALAAEIWLLYSTGPELRSAAILGRVLLKGRPAGKGVVLYEPLEADSARVPGDSAAPGRVRVRYPLAATDDDGLYRLLGIPPGRPFRMRAFVDRNGNLLLDDGELATAVDTLQLTAGEVRRGVLWNVIDPNEPGRVRGVAFNLTSLEAPVAVALQAVSPEPNSVRDATAAAAAADTSAPALVLIDSVGVRADTLRPLPLPVPERAESGWEAAYAALEPRGFRPSEWKVSYASPRGDYSIRVPPGRHRIAAFVDVSGDSIPGLYVRPDSTSLEWEPFWLGGILKVPPGEDVRARAIEIESP
jgi:hypothetical protein